MIRQGIRNLALLLIAAGFVSPCAPQGRYLPLHFSDSEVSIAAQIKVQLGHSRKVTSSVFSRDSRYVLTGSADGTALLWDVESARELRKFGGHTSQVNSVAFSPTRKVVLTGSTDATARLWNIETGDELHRFKEESAVNSVAFSSDGRTILTGIGAFLSKTNNIAHLWDSETGRQLQAFKGHRNNITCVGFVDGDLAVTGSQDGDVRLWKVATGEEIAKFEVEEKSKFSLDPASAFALGVSSFAISADRKLLLAAAPFRARLYDLRSGKVVKRLEWNMARFGSYLTSIESVAFSPDSRHVLTGHLNGVAREWNVSTGIVVRSLKLTSAFITSAAYSPDGRYILIAGSQIRNKESMTLDEVAVTELHDAKSGILVRRLEAYSRPIDHVGFSANGGKFITQTGIMQKSKFSNWVRSWDLHKGVVAKTEMLNSFFGEPPMWFFTPTPNGRYSIVAGVGADVEVRDKRTLSKVFSLVGHSGRVRSVTFSIDGRYAVTGSEDKTARLWDMKTGKEVSRFVGHTDVVTSVSIDPDGEFVGTGSRDGTSRFWKISGDELCELISFDEDWAVVTSDGRFDTNNLEHIRGLHWTMPDDPLTPLPIEIFMRDYYEPHLLPRLLKCNELKNCDDEFKPIRPLASLNRAQPSVKIIEVKQRATSELADVTVEASGGAESFVRTGETAVRQTGVYDLRLFREGQLVGYTTSVVNSATENPTTSNKQNIEIELQQWRARNKLAPDQEEQTGSGNCAPGGPGKVKCRFTVRLPRRTDLKQVEFTAYAFNEDRVKSETHRKVLEIRSPLVSVKPRAYVISVGINDYDNPTFRQLSFAVSDATAIQNEVSEGLRQAGTYELVPMTLLSGKREDGITERLATKENIRAILDVLAGRIDLKAVEGIAGAKSLRRAEPEDMVLLSFSGHGYADAHNNFYLTPQNTSGGAAKEILEQLISSEELSWWLRDIDAGEMVMIIDACHSAGSVDTPGFKPGPLGDRGLGQLAYDKGMRILAATQREDVALEIGTARDGTKMGHGLLTYALVQDGLRRKKADWQPKDSRITIKEWLKYAEQRVPELYKERFSPTQSNTSTSKSAGTRKIGEAFAQTPILFDFARAASKPLTLRIN